MIKVATWGSESVFGRNTGVKDRVIPGVCGGERIKDIIWRSTKMFYSGYAELCIIGRIRYFLRPCMAPISAICS